MVPTVVSLGAAVRTSLPPDAACRSKKKRAAQGAARSEDRAFGP